MRTLRARNYGTVFSGTVLAFVFAVFGFFAHTLESWIPAWQIKVGKETPVTVRLPARYFRITMLRNEVHYLATSSSSCPNLVARGTKLKPGKECSHLALAYDEAQRTQSPGRLAGIFAFYLIVGILLFSFMRYPTMGRARLLRSQVTVFGLLAALMAATKAILLATALPSGIVPVVAVPLIAGYFFRRQFTFIIVLAASLVAASLANFDIDEFLVWVVSGVTGVVVLGRDRRHAWIHLRAGAAAALVAVGFTVVTTLVFAGTLDIHDDVAEHFDPRYSIWLATLAGCVGSGLIAWIATPIIGRAVGTVSRGALLDLQDLDQRLLTRLRERAPGTWEHARAVANLAEAATHAIGGNALLVRVGAYYHDTGKCATPELFVENQGGGKNPHDALEPEESAHRIFRHVADGTRMLREEGVPEDVVEFCYSHHGTSVLEYFWHKAMSQGNPKELTEADFIYPGHKPSTREAGILMVVDAIEAGARTVDAPTKEAFQNLVQKIVFSKLSQGQLDETGLSLSDLRLVVNTLVDALVNIHHARVKYPWQTGDTTGSIRLAEERKEGNGNGAKPATNGNGIKPAASTPPPVSVPPDDPMAPVPLEPTPLALERKEKS